MNQPPEDLPPGLCEQCGGFPTANTTHCIAWLCTVCGCVFLNDLPLRTDSKVLIWNTAPFPHDPRLWPQAANRHVKLMEAAQACECGGDVTFSVVLVDHIQQYEGRLAGCCDRCGPVEAIEEYLTDTGQHVCFGKPEKKGG